MEKVKDSDIDQAILDEYEIGETLGTGHFSKVKLGIDKKTGEKVAIKIINKPTGSKIAMLKTEVDIMTRTDHPNVVKLHKVHETPTVLYLVMEILTGGELFDRIVAKGHYSEADARKLTITMLNAVLYLHEMGIAHRDLKPENLLLKDTSEEAIIKITDFGLSKIFADDAQGEVVMKTACGTPGYVAPEVLTHENYSSQVDLWSIGVIVYILLCGFPPFYGDNDAQMFRKIKAGTYKFLSPYWDPISADAKDFVSKLLVVDPKKRLDCKAALDHKWLKADQVSSKNLFEGKAEAEKGAEATQEETDGGVDTMQQMFTDFNIDRKVGAGMENLRKTFDLPADSVRLRKSRCALVSQLGSLYVTSYHICFIGGLGKKLVIPLTDLDKVAKAKRFKLSPGKGHALHMTDKAGTTHQFNAFTDRDEVIASIREQCKTVGAAVKFEEN
jgi:calcium/calmodulin-dependent protein kinase I